MFLPVLHFYQDFHKRSLNFYEKVCYPDLILMHPYIFQLLCQFDSFCNKTHPGCYENWHSPAQCLIN